MTTAVTDDTDMGEDSQWNTMKQVTGMLLMWMSRYEAIQTCRVCNTLNTAGR